MLTKILAVTMAAGLGYGGLVVFKGDCCSNRSSCPTGSCNVLDASCCARPATTENADAKPDCCYPGSPCCYPGSPCCTDASVHVVMPDCCYPGSPCCYPGSPCCGDSCCPNGACCPDGPCCGTVSKCCGSK